MGDKADADNVCLPRRGASRLQEVAPEVLIGLAGSHLCSHKTKVSEQTRTFAAALSEAKAPVSACEVCVDSSNSGGLFQ